MHHIVIAPPGAVESALQAFVVPDTREAIELAVEAFLTRLDEIDGDADLEESDTEDSFALSEHALRLAEAEAGCPISDPGGCQHDGREVTGAEDDFMFHGSDGPGCPISDAGGTGDEL
jgi:hypothetical protein